MNGWSRLLFASCVILVMTGSAIRAGLLDEPTPVNEVKTKTVHASLVPENPEASSTRFTTDATKISVIWTGQGLKAGDQLSAIWFAEDLGIASQRESKITEEHATAYKPDDDGAFALGRPKEGWPAGKYRVEILLNSRLVQALRFTIEPGATIEVR
jgi:hypothetical protein